VPARETPSQLSTVRPPFDPQEFARESERATQPPRIRAPSEAPELASGTTEIFLPVEATTIPELTVAREDLEWFDLPAGARRILAYIDGDATVEIISSRAGLPLTDTIDLVEELAHEGLVVPR
jgi:hypothetical protein